MHIDIILRGTHDSNAKFKQLIHETFAINVLPFEYLTLAFEKEKLPQILAVLKAFEEPDQNLNETIRLARATAQELMKLEKVDLENVTPHADFNREKLNLFCNTAVLGSRQDQFMDVKTASGTEKREMI